MRGKFASGELGILVGISSVGTFVSGWGQWDVVEVPRSLGLRFQKLILGPFMMNDNVHLERPRSVSGSWTAAVNSLEIERIIMILSVYQLTAE
jgi:hypothetical protein